MTFSTLSTLADQVIRILSGGNVRSSSDYVRKEVKVAVSQVMASVLKLQVIEAKEGIPFSTIAEYEVDVTEVDDCNSKAELPIQPYALPMGMGVWAVFKPGQENCQFVPIVTGASTLLLNTTHSGMADLLGSEVIGYEPSGRTLKIKRPKSDVGDKLTVQLLVSDLTKMGDNDLLPISQDMETVVIQETLKLLGVNVDHDDTNDGTDS